MADNPTYERRFTNTGSNVRDRKLGLVAHFPTSKDAAEAYRLLVSDPTLVRAFAWQEQGLKTPESLRKGGVREQCIRYPKCGFVVPNSLRIAPLS